MRKLLIGLVLSVIATTVSAEWVFVTDGENGDMFYVDPATKRRTGNVVRIWALTDFKKPSTFAGKEYNSERAYRQYDCFEITTQTLQANGFSGKMGAGEVVGSTSQAGAKVFVPPKTIAEILLNFACK
jgi:hypothetical protein